MDFNAALLLFAPLALAIACVAAAIALWRAKPGERDEQDPRTRGQAQVQGFFVGCLLFVAFGIGACYAYFFLFFRL
ncbi:MAG: hypothetical protein IPN34_08490 [Planctomycetes bacterium]|nr:hypothetical protein [Planctomycetota bacterium]